MSLTSSGSVAGVCWSGWAESLPTHGCRGTNPSLSGVKCLCLRGFQFLSRACPSRHPYLALRIEQHSGPRWRPRPSPVASSNGTLLDSSVEANKALSDCPSCRAHNVQLFMCKQCGQEYCENCVLDDRCPNCESAERSEPGKAWWKFPRD